MPEYQKSEENNERSSRPRTRFDRTRRNIAIAAVLLIVMLGMAGVVGVQFTEDRATSRGSVSAPRYVDMWAVYPDGRVRMASIYHPLADTTDELIELAGPLMPGEQAVINDNGIGATIQERQTLPGPGHDASLYYNLYTLRRTDINAPYGINVLTDESPYLVTSPTAPDSSEFSIGVVPQNYYNQVIVAVAFPRGTEVEVAEGPADMSPYRYATVAGWQVYYYDVTDVTGNEAVRLSFTPIDRTPADFKPERVDRRR